MTFLRTAIFLLLVIIISNCTQIGRQQGLASNHSRQPLPAEAYLAMAKNQVGEEKESLLLLAASRTLQDNHSEAASRILAQINPQSRLQDQQYQILSARLLFIQGKPKSALAKLASIGKAEDLNRESLADYHETLALIYQSRGDLSQAVNERIQLDPLLKDDNRQIQNRRLLWLHLTKLPQAELNTLALESHEDSFLKAWMKLALIARKEKQNPNQLLTEIIQWQQNYPNHPANSLLPPSLEAIRSSLYPFPRQIALLLPLSGPLSGPGLAIKDGFIAALKADNASKNLHLYDTNTADAITLYHQALADGADYVVGPLTRSDTAKLAGIAHPVPTLMLNDINSSMDQNGYKFGLSPSNEARQVAMKANQKGLRKALIIAPAGEWGNDIAKAFKDQLTALGGTVVDTLAFENNTDLTTAVREFLHVSEKEAQEKQVRSSPGQPIALAEKRRNDFDMIFLLAYPSKARQIMPLIKYYFASDIPVYATSTVYAGNTNTMKDRDLDGIIFCDMPWVFANQLPNKNWPEQLNAYSRLYAIGMDSYALSNQLNQLLIFPAMGMNDNSGVLYLNKAQRIGRVLAWGKFNGGVATKVEETT